MSTVVRNAFLLLALAVTAVSCGSVNNQVIVRDRQRLIVDAAKLVSHYPDLRLMDEAAILSAATYDDPSWPTTKSLPEYCVSGDGLAFDPSGQGWVEDTNIPGPPQAPPGVRAIRDLKYRVWVKAHPDGSKVAMLAFRGTQSRPDWFSNLRWITRIVPKTWDHYEQFVAVAPEVFAAIRKNHGDATTIIATGHSLGGGLAQLAGYASGGVVDVVFGFDPSVVTHFYGVDAATRDASRKGQSIYRIFEQGEVLSYVRWILKRVYPIKHQNPRIVQVKFHRLSGGLLSDHSIRRFACAGMPAESVAATSNAVARAH